MKPEILSIFVKKVQPNLFQKGCNQLIILRLVSPPSSYLVNIQQHLTFKSPTVQFGKLGKQCLMLQKEMIRLPNTSLVPNEVSCLLSAKWGLLPPVLVELYQSRWGTSDHSTCLSES